MLSLGQRPDFFLIIMAILLFCTDIWPSYRLLAPALALSSALWQVLSAEQLTARQDPVSGVGGQGQGTLGYGSPLG